MEEIAIAAHHRAERMDGFGNLLLGLPGIIALKLTLQVTPENSSYIMGVTASRCECRTSRVESPQPISQPPGRSIRRSGSGKLRSGHRKQFTQRRPTGSPSSRILATRRIVQVAVLEERLTPSDQELPLHWTAIPRATHSADRRGRGLRERLLRRPDRARVSEEPHSPPHVSNMFL